MAVNIAIGKQAEAKAQPQTETTSNFDPEVDELVTLLNWQAKLKKDPRMVRLAELQKKYADKAKEFDDEPEKDDIAFEGEKYRYLFGKRAQTRTVTDEGKVKFANKVGEEAFIACATIALKDIDQYIAKGEQADYLDYGYGSRTAKVEAKMPEKK